MRAKLCLLLASVLTFAVYWPGLSGPFLFDDYWNLGPLELWYAGKQSWFATLLPNPDSVLFSRPVSMSSFMLTTWLGGIGPFSYKLGNLVVHLLCGVTTWWLLRRTFREDPQLSGHAEVLAVSGAALWLLHPLHVSTVLYAVQRMAQLSTLFTLAAVGVYVVARCQLKQDRLKPAVLNLFVAFPLLLLAGLLSKQNAAVAPFLCLVFELAYFSRDTMHRGAVKTFYAIFALLPLLAVTLLLLIAPQKLIGSYSDWDFTLMQRLLTQPRVLMDYLGMLLIPRGPVMGLFTDDFPISTGLLHPVTTLLSIVGLIVLSASAFAMRKRAPSVFAGWFFFLVSHAVESTFLPLEMYYEHRNYLPAVGILMALIGLCGLVPSTYRANVLNLRKLGLIAATGLALVLAFATLGRSLVWQTDESIIAQGVNHHPNSVRAMLDYAVLALWKENYEQAIRITAPLRASDNPRHRVIGYLQRVAVRCLQGSDGADPKDITRAVKNAMPKVTVLEVQMVRLLVNATQGRECGEVTPGMLGDGFVGLLDATASQPEESPNKYSIRMNASQMYARAGRWHDAEQQAEIAWKASGNLPVAALLIRFYIKNGNYDDARRLLAEMKRRLRPFDSAGWEEMARLKVLLDGADPQGTEVGVEPTGNEATEG